MNLSSNAWLHGRNLKVGPATQPGVDIGRPGLKKHTTMS